MKAQSLVSAFACGTFLALLGPAARAAEPLEARTRSLVAFGQMASVMTSPRCENCHTVTDFPRQGDDRHRHTLNIHRGADGQGEPGMRCTTCHSDANNSASGVPGADDVWRLAPLSMGWEGLSRADLCRHLKDPKHNGGRTGSDVIDHLKTHLVTWAWSPGETAHGRVRAPPPVGYEAFMAAARSWVATGQACPA